MWKGGKSVFSIHNSRVVIDGDVIVGSSYWHLQMKCDKEKTGYQEGLVGRLVADIQNG